MAAMLHDVGKLDVPTGILTKRDKLTRKEMDLLQKHVPLGVDLIMDIPACRRWQRGLSAP